MVNMPVTTISEMMNLTVLARMTTPVNEVEAGSLYFEGMEQREQDIHDECEGTCLWLLEHKNYCNWTKNSPALLLIKGSPGTGTELQKSPLGLWRSLLHQILNQSVDLQAKFQENFEKKFKTRGQNGTIWVWREDDLKEFFKTCVAEKYQVTIFIDALDECGKVVATDLVRYVQRLIGRTQSKLNVCFSCRHFPAVADDHKSTTIIVEDENGEDIQKNIQNDLEFAFREEQDKLQVLLAEISGKASGSFQWANIAASRAIQSFRLGSSMNDILDELWETPTELSELYSTILAQIPPKERHRSLRLMQWLSLAARPLSLRELRFAMAADWPGPSGQFPRLHRELEQSSKYEDDNQMARLVRNLSGGLAEVKIVKNQGEEQIAQRVVQLIHESVKEFLVQDGLQKLGWSESSIGQGDSQLSNVCMRYATLEDVCDKIRAGQFDELPFLEYAVTYWGFHAEQAGRIDDSQNNQPGRFVWPSEDTLQRWIEVYRLVNRDDQATLLHYCSRHGLLNAIKLLPDQGVAVDSQDKEGHTPLSLAALHGHREVVVLLLEMGAQADCKSKRGHTPLMYAVRSGYEEIVNILLAKDIDVDRHVDVADTKGRTALSYAAENGHVKIVRLLLERAVIVDNKDQKGRTPLSYAAENGHIAAMQLLFERDARADTKTKWGHTPLVYAAENGHPEVVHLLLTKDVNVNSQGWYGRTPLSWAAGNGHEDTVKPLLDTGEADVNSKDYDERTALSRAAENGCEKVVKLLLDANGDVDSRDEEGRTPLWYAAADGHREVIQLLLEAGANVNARDNRGWGPLWFAGENKHPEVVQLLLDAGAEANPEDEEVACCREKACGDDTAPTGNPF
ncbi:hypothetical protein DL771_002856 [Monosporascus sp. 5C6A]|nr:hypothetical protein DL771_002856 [Monosporascus sp. 5C6A]